MIWDQMFGTYQAERKDVKATFGLTNALPRPSNVFNVAFGQLMRFAKSIVSAPNWKSKLSIFFGPPQ
jgi:sterol desaturase/sphingolipid hydroxylase (fatty acid hydroxylase superfamily)